MISDQRSWINRSFADHFALVDWTLMFKQGKFSSIPHTVSPYEVCAWPTTHCSLSSSLLRHMSNLMVSIRTVHDQIRQQWTETGVVVGTSAWSNSGQSCINPSTKVVGSELAGLLWRAYTVQQSKSNNPVVNLDHLPPHGKSVVYATPKHILLMS